jgi:hypothetical protein
VAETKLNTCIPRPSFYQETSSRKVLKDEIAVGGSPRALTVLPAFGSQMSKLVPAGTDLNEYVAGKKAGKSPLSWAERVKKGVS